MHSSILDDLIQLKTRRLPKRGTCSSCKHWERLGETYGKCRICAQWVKWEYIGMFPKTNDDDFCEQYEPSK